MGHVSSFNNPDQHFNPSLLLDKVRDFLRAQLFGSAQASDDPYPPIAVAYSGGLDSTVLLHLVCALDLHVHAVHVNHHLQTESDAWVLHCKKFALELGIPIKVLHVHPLSVGNGLEAQARIERYRAIFQWMNSWI